jgi:D-alanyl-D-alanine dipeptidase
MYLSYGENSMPLIKITASDDLLIDLAYGTTQNFTGKVIYQQSGCYLHKEAVPCLEKAMALARPLGLRLKILDAFRPVEAQQVLWSVVPDEQYEANPAKGSNHSRGVAVDLTLVDSEGRELDMGTPFDDFTVQSHHGNQDISLKAQQNRFLLLGIMSAAGWDFYQCEWWHYQLFDPKRFVLLSDESLDDSMM